jgi:hypothetical protein
VRPSVVRRSSLERPDACLNPLDCCREQSVSVSREGEEHDMAELTITTGLKEIAKRLGHAAAIAKGAVTCAETWSEREALRIAMDLDELISEAGTLHGALCLLGRMERDAPR